jgi:hypothetical protein
MNPVTAGKVKYGVWGLICGAIIATIIGFAWGGWTTERTTQRLSQKTSEEAVLAARAAICVAQFMKEPNYHSPFAQSTSHILNCKLPVELSPQPQPLQDGFLPS